MWILWILFGVLVGCLILLLYLIHPGARREAGWVREFAHRGLHGGEIPENSLAAFRAAREKGAGVELDVQFTKDGKLVVFHDRTLLRMCGVDRPVAACTYEEVRTCSLAGTSERIPLLEEVLPVLGDLPVVCEIKPYAGKDLPLLCQKTAEQFDHYPGNVCYESFSPFAVRWFRKNRPANLRGQLSANARKGEEGLKGYEAFALRNLLVNCLGRPDFIAFDFKADTFGFWFCRTFFRPILVAWTARGDKERAAVPAFYDAVIFETFPKEEE